MPKTVGLLWLVVVVLGSVTGAAEETSTERRLRILEEQLRKAQEEIQRLKGEVQQQKAIEQATQKQAEQAGEEAKVATAEAKKGGESPDWMKRLTPFGDVRVRYEGFFHQPAKEGTKVTARNRERLRFRLGLKYAFSDELSATMRMATGNINDPISTNEDLGNSFTRKNFNTDWAFITFTPGTTFNMSPGLLTMTGGKFPNPMFRVNELVYDDDLSPEGFSQTLALLPKPVGALDQLKLYVEQWTFGEVSNGPDGWMLGGQINPSLHFGNTQVQFGVAQYWWDNPNLIAQQTNTNSVLKSTNTTFTGTVNGKANQIAGFGTSAADQAGFLQTNPSVQVTFPNFVGTQPLNLFADYVYNWQAATSGNAGYQAGWRIGQQRVRGDWSLYAFWERLEQNAVLSEFTASDFGPGGTNEQGGQVGIEYQLLNPLTISTRSWFTNYIAAPPLTNNPTLFRVQVDALLKF